MLHILTKSYNLHWNSKKLKKIQCKARHILKESCRTITCLKQLLIYVVGISCTTYYANLRLQKYLTWGKALIFTLICTESVNIFFPERNNWNNKYQHNSYVFKWDIRVPDSLPWKQTLLRFNIWMYINERVVVGNWILRNCASIYYFN